MAFEILDGKGNLVTICHAVDSQGGFIIPAEVTNKLSGKGVISVFDLTDNGRVLNTGGVDPSCTVFDQNEGHDWTAPL